MSNNTTTNNNSIVAIAVWFYGCDIDDIHMDDIEMSQDGSYYISDPTSDGEIGSDLEIQAREDGYYYRSHPFFCDAPGYYEEPSEWTLWVPKAESKGLEDAVEEMFENINSPEYTEELSTIRDLKIMRGTEIREVCRRYDERIANRKATLRAEGRWFDRKEEQRIPLSKDTVVCSVVGSAADSVVKIDDACTKAYNEGYALGCKIKAWFTKRGK